MTWVASTRWEWPYWFTWSGYPEQAIAKLEEARDQGRVVIRPVDNPIRAVEVSIERARKGLARQTEGR